MVPPHVPGARPQHVPGDRAGTSRNAGRWGTAPGRTCAREGRTDRRAASSWPGYGGARPPPTGGTKLGRTPGSREGLPNRGVATELSPPTRSSASTGSSAFLATRCGASWWAGRAPPEASLRWSAADRGARAPAPPGPQSHPGKSPRGSAFLGCLRLSRPAGLPRWPEWGWGGSGLGRLEAAGGPQVPKAREGSRALGAPRYAHRSVLGLKERAQPAQGSISVRVSKAG